MGDALSGLLVVDAILRRRRWTFAQWAALYADLPSRQTKLAVADRAVRRAAASGPLFAWCVVTAPRRG